MIPDVMVTVVVVVVVAGGGGGGEVGDWLYSLHAHR